MKNPKQLEFKKVNGWGGKRKGAGRPNKTGLVAHAKRERVTARTPVHITLKVRKNTVNLRCGEILALFKKRAERMKKHGAGIVHFSLQRDHMHLKIEAKNNEALSKGLSGFVSGFAKEARKIVGGVGPVFVGRYHLHVLKTPTEVKRALEYILMNFSKHMNLIFHIDEFSSAEYFREWRALLGRKMGPMIRDKCGSTWPTFLEQPRSWLATEGWKRAAA